MAHMVLRLEISVRTALERGSNVAGSVDRDLTEADLADLDEYERAALVRFVSPSDAAPPHFPPHRLPVESCEWADIKAALASLGEQKRREEQREQARAALAEQLLAGPVDELVTCREGAQRGLRWDVATRVIDLVGYQTNAPLYQRARDEVHDRNRREWRELSDELMAAPVDDLLMWSEHDKRWHPLLNAYNAPRGLDVGFPALDRAKAEALRRNEQLAKEARREIEEAEEALLEAAGTESQRERWRAGVLPEAEIRDLARGCLMAPLASYPSRPKLGDNDLNHAPGCEPGRREVDVEVCDDGAAVVTAPQWDALKDMQRACDDHVAHKGASPIRVKLIKVAVQCTDCGAVRADVSVRAEMRWAGRTLTRELAL